MKYTYKMRWNAETREDQRMIKVWKMKMFIQMLHVWHDRLHRCIDIHLNDPEWRWVKIEMWLDWYEDSWKDFLHTCVTIMLWIWFLTNPLISHLSRPFKYPSFIPFLPLLTVQVILQSKCKVIQNGKIEIKLTPQQCSNSPETNGYMN